MSEYFFEEIHCLFFKFDKRVIYLNQIFQMEHGETIHTFKDEMTGFGPSISENGIKVQ